MKIQKRSGDFQDISFDKILHRIKKLVSQDIPLEFADSGVVTQEVIKSIFNNIKSSDLDELAARICIGKSIEHPDYGTLASRIIISNMHKSTLSSFSDVMESLYSSETQVVSEQLINFVRENKKKLDSKLVYSRDYLFDYFGFKTLERGYLLKKYDGTDYILAERPQHMWMRVSIGIHPSDFNAVIQTYDLMSQFYFTHASPTLFNSGTPKQQLSSCFLLDLPDSMKGIYKTLGDSAMISKHAGGIGMSISKIRSKGSHIKGTNGRSDGLIRMLKVFNETARFANQGSKRNGSFAMYIEPWHADIFEFLELRKNTGDETLRARDLFYGMWIPDIFMRAVETDSDWYLMSNDTSPGLVESYSTDFDVIYNNHVAQGNYKKVVKARDLWNRILTSQIETGMPYMAYKDAVNNKSNLKNVSVIKSSNLCIEIMLPNSDTEIAVCNIATLGLSKYIEILDGKPVYNFEKLRQVVKIVTRNLNCVIDNNFYPVPETRTSNINHRPIAIGAQGLANTFFEMGYSFESDEAKQLNKDIYETIQFAGLEMSCELAQEYEPYSTFEGSPASKGIFQHNMWGIKNSDLKWGWDNLKERVMKHGLRNSMITASPPTASTSQILGNYESFEPVNSNMFMRNTLSGDFPIVNKFLINDLIKLDLWDNDMKQELLYNQGSIQNISRVPKNLKGIYKTVWEISQKNLLDMSYNRGLFTDHSQSLNVYMKNPTISKLSSMHFHGWKIGLKTGSYYIRTMNSSKAEGITVSKETRQRANEALVCSIENKDACVSCSG